MAAVVLEKPFRRKRSADSVLDGPGEAFTSEEVAEHCTEDDCYIVINGKVNVLLISLTSRALQTGSLWHQLIPADRPTWRTEHGSVTECGALRPCRGSLLHFTTYSRRCR
jgi:hypothetical protein